MPILTVVVEGVAYMGRLASRRGMYARARVRADETGKPLVVVGAIGRPAQHPCGDLSCVHVKGCAACGAKEKRVELPGAIAVRDGGAVVLVQHALEYTKDIDAAWQEVTRAAGSSSDVFVSRMQPWATWTRLSTGQLWHVDEAPPVGGELKYRSTRREPRTVVRGCPPRVYGVATKGTKVRR